MIGGPTSDAPLVFPLVPAPDPAWCCERLAAWPCRIFLDSAAAGRHGRYSFVTADPCAVASSAGGRTAWTDATTGHTRSVEGDVLAAVETFLAPYRSAPIEALPPFQGGAAGYLSYDWGKALEAIAPARCRDLAMPDAVLGIYDWVLAWDHVRDAAWLISTGLPETAPARRGVRARARADAVFHHLDTGAAPSQGPSRVEAPPVSSSFTRNGYLAAVARVRRFIVDGDIFQANLSQRFEATLDETPWAYYQRLRVCSPAPFAAFLDLPDGAVMSASPERFIRLDTSGTIETRPIKGTRPRGRTTAEDRALVDALAASAKDRAENVMIVDLMRNDLSRVCAPGTMRVAELCAIESYATVHHLVSSVTARIAAGRSAADVLRATLPAGSITGAPKIRAMEIIAALEPSERGVYAGAIGYLSVSGTMDTNVAIRTAVAPAVTHAGDVNRRVYFSAGGGIVADSDPEQEYAETLDKAAGLIAALASTPVAAGAR